LFRVLGGLEKEKNAKKREANRHTQNALLFGEEGIRETREKKKKAPFGWDETRSDGLGFVSSFLSSSFLDFLVSP
jgi:hypothetical protein